MIPLSNDVQENVRRFNEDEAIWRCFEDRRWIRRMLGAPSEEDEKTLDDVDWLEAERVARATRAIGKWIAP